MKLRRLSSKQIHDMILDGKNHFYTMGERRVTVISVHYSDSISYSVETEDSPEGEQVFIATQLFTKEGPNMRPMTRYEAMLKAEQLSAENAKAKDQIWLVSNGNMEYFPITVGYHHGIISWTYAKYNMKGRKLTEDFKFEIEE